MMVVNVSIGCGRTVTHNSCGDMSKEEYKRLQALSQSNADNPRFDMQSDDPAHCTWDYVSQKKNYVWLGKGPDNCNRVAADCEKFGLVHDGVTHLQGDPGDVVCTKGHKIRCVPPTPPNLVTTSNNELKIMSYNSYERPFYISRDGQRERTCRIPYTFIKSNPDVDVIGLQEIFMEGCFETDLNITHLFQYYGFEYVTYPLKQSGKMLPGGVIIASRWPIIKSEQHVFKTVSKWSAESFAAKGVRYAKIRKSVEGKYTDYNIMVTHLQAFDMNMNSGIRVEGVRLGQSVEWGKFYEDLNIPTNEPVIFAGDFNIDLHTRQVTMDRISKNLNAAFPKLHIKEDDFTWGPSNDIWDFRSDTTAPSFIDYILYGINHTRPIEADFYVFRPIVDAFPTCWCEGCLSWTKYRWIDDLNCLDKIKYFTSLSDHQAVMAKFVF